jgi:hypothetical protein
MCRLTQPDCKEAFRELASEAKSGPSQLWRERHQKAAEPDSLASHGLDIDDRLPQNIGKRRLTGAIYCRA